MIYHIPIPPPLSALFANAGSKGRVSTARYLTWKNQALTMMAASGNLPRLPIREEVEVTCSFKRPDDRRRDLDNLAKASLDVLVAAAVILDDSQVMRLTLQWDDRISGALISIIPFER